MPTRDEVATDDVTTASDVVPDAFVAELQTHPELPPTFTSPDARESYRRGLRNDFARANGADPSTTGPGIALAAGAPGCDEGTASATTRVTSTATMPSKTALTARAPRQYRMAPAEKL